MEKKAKALLIPLASEVVPEELTLELLKEIARKSKTANAVAFEIIPEIINERNLEREISLINSLVKDFNCIILMHLTGGTSKLALEILVNLTQTKPFAIWAHGSFNSLASAFNTKLKVQSLLNVSIPLPIIYEDIKALEEFALLAEAVDHVYQSHKILLIGPTTGIRVPKGYHVTQSLRLRNLLKPAKEEEVMEVFERIKKWLPSEEISNNEEIIKALTIYINIKKILASLSEKKKGTKLATIECYNLMKYFNVAPCLAVSLLLDDGYIITCQRDIPSLFGFLLLKKITGQSIWLADISKILWEDRVVVFSHSCADPKLAVSDDKIVIKKHPLKGVYATLYVPLKVGIDVTIVQVDILKNELIWFEGKIVGPDKPYENIETTQASVKLSERDFINLMNKNVGSHFLLVYGRWGKTIDKVNELLKQVNILRELKGR